MGRMASGELSKVGPFPDLHCAEPAVAVSVALPEHHAGPADGPADAGSLGRIPRGPQQRLTHQDDGGDQ